MKIQKANVSEIEMILQHDKHIAREELENSINLGRVYTAYDNGEFCGWLRYNLFWDNTPFMNMLYFFEDFRGRGYGSKMVEYWEMEMKNKDYSMILTSTQTDETAQHFYMKLGYKTIGGFLLENDPFEIILSKKL